MISSPDVVILPDGRLNRKNASAYIGNAEKTLAQYAVKGIGPRFVKRGGRVWYFQKDLDAWIAGETPPTPAPPAPVIQTDESRIESMDKARAARKAKRGAPTGAEA